MQKQSVRKAVIPVAGLGTRFLPITKAIPKEMLAIVDKPAIHFVVEEAFSAGIKQIILVNGHHKYSIENYFDINYELNDILEKKGKKKELASLDSISNMGAIFSVRQKFPLGLGHAVLCAEPFIGNEPFAVLLGDDIICSTKSEGPAIGQMIESYRDTRLSQIALLQVDRSQVHKYGAAEGKADKNDARKLHITNLVEKPPFGKEKTDLVVVGRYVLTPNIFPLLHTQEPDASGEIQLTDALHRLMQTDGMIGYRFAGTRIDTGDRAGLLRLNLMEALSRPELKDDVLKMMHELLG